ncbi:hypothetical protein RFI_30524, partial [Reticulomyxa filosa]
MTFLFKRWSSQNNCKVIFFFSFFLTIKKKYQIIKKVNTDGSQSIDERKFTVNSEQLLNMIFEGTRIFAYLYLQEAIMPMQLDINEIKVNNDGLLLLVETQDNIYIKIASFCCSFFLLKKNEQFTEEVMHISANTLPLIGKLPVKLAGGMQNESKTVNYEGKVKALIKLYGDVAKEDVLKKKLEQSNGNVLNVVDQMTVTLNQNTAVQHSIEEIKTEQVKTIDILFLTYKTNDDAGVNSGLVQEPDKLKKEEEKAEIGEIKPGINLQGYCTNIDCLASKAKLLVWINIGFCDISFNSEKTLYNCPDCGQLTVTSIIKAVIFNSEHVISSNDNPIPVKDNHYQSLYAIKLGSSYEIKAKRIRQHATSLEDLINRSENAMTSNEIINL